MVSITLPIARRLARFTMDSASFARNNAFVRARSSYAIPSQRRSFSAATEERKDDGSETQAQAQLPETPLEKKLKAELELLTKEVAELREQRSELENKYKRALADGENLRIRLTKQIEDAKLFGIQAFCKDLLDVADVLSKATESVPKDEISEKNPHLKSLYEGLRMTEAQLQKVFRKHGLVSLNPIDEKFDPNQHEALFQQEVEGKKAGTIVVVSKIGYKLHERIVRPALVGVAKG